MGKLLTNEVVGVLTDEIVRNTMAQDNADLNNREAKRIAAIAESMNIIRTLNSHRKIFTVSFEPRIIEIILGEPQVKTAEILNLNLAKMHGRYNTFITLEW